MDEQALAAAVAHLREADYVLLSAGAGLSAPAGISYSDRHIFGQLMPGLVKLPGAPQCFWDCMSGKMDIFKDRRRRTALFSIWGHFMTTHGAHDPTYAMLLKIVEHLGKPWFVTTTNGDEMFMRNGFDAEKVYTMNGSWRLLQCGNMLARGCRHVWAAEPEWQKLGIDHGQAGGAGGSIDHEQCRVPEPKPTIMCPNCGKQDSIWPNLNGGSYYVHDHWNDHQDAYQKFIEGAIENKKKLVILEVGVGYNSPGAIRIPSERLAQKGAVLLRVNAEYAHSEARLAEPRQFVPLQLDSATAISKLGALLGVC